MMAVASIMWADLAPFIVIGFLAQLVDGTLGLAFGALSTSLLMLVGIPPATAIATVRTVESFTTGASGIAHALQRNVDWTLFARLVGPGILGSLVGIWLFLLIKPDILRPIVLVYLLTTGIYLLWRAPRRAQTFRRMRMVGPLALVGGLADAGGSGGWGPFVTGNLLAQGMTPRTAIGTVNAAEFFVTITALVTFIGVLDIKTFSQAALGLLIGGIAAAPLGAWLTKRITSSALLRMVGGVLVLIGAAGLTSLMFSPISVFHRL